MSKIGSVALNNQLLVSELVNEIIKRRQEIDKHDLNTIINYLESEYVLRDFDLYFNRS